MNAGGWEQPCSHLGAANPPSARAAMSPNSVSRDIAGGFVCLRLGRSGHSPPCKAGSPKKEESINSSKINILKLEKAIPSNPCWDSLCPRGWHGTKPGKSWFCSRRAEMRGGYGRNEGWVRKNLGV